MYLFPNSKCKALALWHYTILPCSYNHITQQNHNLHNWLIRRVYHYQYSTFHMVRNILILHMMFDLGLFRGMQGQEVRDTIRDHIPDGIHVRCFCGE